MSTCPCSLEYAQGRAETVEGRRTNGAVMVVSFCKRNSKTEGLRFRSDGSSGVIGLDETRMILCGKVVKRSAVFPITPRHRERKTSREASLNHDGAYFKNDGKEMEFLLTISELSIVTKSNCLSLLIHLSESIIYSF